MKKVIFVLFLLASFSILCACEAKIETPVELPTEDSFLLTNDIVPLKTYSVYEIYENNSESEFDQILKANPIDKKMRDEIQVKDLSSTQEQQAFFDYYCKLWQEEILNSITNLEAYLNNEQIVRFESAQSAWEKSIAENTEIDQTLIQEMGVGLGTQMVPSRLITVMNQYRDRAFHIKYMTMLIENQVENPIEKDKQLWNHFKNQ